MYEQRLDCLAAIIGQRIEHVGGRLVREGLDHVGRDVVVLEGERVDDLLGGQTGQQVATEVRFDVVEGLGGGLDVEGREDLRPLVVGQPLERVGEFGAVE